MMCDSRMWRAQIRDLLPHAQAPVHQSMTNAIPNAWLQVVPDCGHLSTMEQPDAVSAAMQAWLQAA